MHIYSFHILFHYGFSQDFDYSYLCFTKDLVVYPQLIFQIMPHPEQY